MPVPEGDRYLGFVFARGRHAGRVERALRRAQACSTCASRSTDVRADVGGLVVTSRRARRAVTGTATVGACASLLVSTYELGHQPLHVASPAGALAAGRPRRALPRPVGRPARPRRSSRGPTRWRCSVPMHTAMRLALSRVRRDRAPPPRPAAVPLRPVRRPRRRARRASTAVWSTSPSPGEYEPGLVAWVDGLVPAPDAASRRHGAPPVARPWSSLGRGTLRPPGPPSPSRLDRYARLAVGGERRLAGYVEASHGCAHRCRHCPVPVVYDGRTRLVGRGRRGGRRGPARRSSGPATSPSATPTS